MTKFKNPPLTLYDLSDRELLLVLRDVADGDGYAESAAIAMQLDLGGDRPHIPVAMRLSWLARYGAVEKEHKRDATGAIRYHKSGKVMHTQRWRLTDVGLAIATGKLRKSHQDAFAKFGDGETLMAIRTLSARLYESGTDHGIGKLATREFKHQTGMR